MQPTLRTKRVNGVRNFVKTCCFLVDIGTADSPEQILVTVNPSTGGDTLVGATGGTVSTFTNLADHTLYGVGYTNSNLYSFNPATGAATLIGATGLLSNSQGIGNSFGIGQDLSLLHQYVSAGESNVDTLRTESDDGSRYGDRGDRGGGDHWVGLRGADFPARPALAASRLRAGWTSTV